MQQHYVVITYFKQLEGFAGDTNAIAYFKYVNTYRAF